MLHIYTYIIHFYKLLIKRKLIFINKNTKYFIHIKNRKAWPINVQAFQPSYFAITSYLTIVVPVLPCRASLALSRDVTIAFLPSLDSANITAAFTLGSMEPGAKCPSFIYS